MAFPIDGQLLLSIARSIERLLITGAGVLALWFGFRLFLARITNRQEAELVTKDFSLKLSKVGPGIFFAALGSGILIYAILAPLKETTTESSGSSSSTSYLNADSTLDKEKCEAINTVRPLIVRAIAAAPSDSTEKRHLAEANELLTKIRDKILADVFGAERLQWSKANIDKFSENETLFSKEDRTKLLEIQPWLSGELED